MRASLILLTGTLGAALPAQVRMTTEKALELAFPDCKVERRTVTLDEEQLAAAGEHCDQEVGKSIVFPYVAKRDGKVVGTAWFDVHRVRSKKQLLMVVVGPDRKVARVELLAFAEPDRYAPPDRWLDHLDGKGLGEVQPGRDVPRITGATLTVRATTRCVDRVLAIHRVVFPPPAEPETECRPTSRPTSGSTSRPTSRPMSRPTSRPMSRPTSRSTSRPADDATAKDGPAKDARAKEHDASGGPP